MIYMFEYKLVGLGVVIFGVWLVADLATQMTEYSSDQLNYLWLIIVGVILYLAYITFKGEGHPKDAQIHVHHNA